MHYPDRVIRPGETDAQIMRSIRRRLRDLQYAVPATGPYDDALVPEQRGRR